MGLAHSPLTNWPGSHHSHHGNMGNAAWSNPPRPEKGGNALEGEGGERCVILPGFTFSGLLSAFQGFHGRAEKTLRVIEFITSGHIWGFASIFFNVS